MHEPFAELALLLLICALAGAVFVRLSQPVLIAYIAVGIAVGPAGFGLVAARDEIDLLAQVGVAVLLFLVGLKLDLNRIRHIGAVALATGIGQLTFTIGIGFLLILALGKGVVEALYLAVALTFSSTIIIVKLLSDKRELDSLHGRIAVGFLIVQDLAVVIAMMAMSTFAGSGVGGRGWGALLFSLSWRLAFAAVTLYVLMRWVLPTVVAAMARSQELLLVFAIVPQWDSNRALLHALGTAHYRGQVVGAVRDAAHGHALAAAGVTCIFNPFEDAADHAAGRIARDIRQREPSS